MASEITLKGIATESANNETNSWEVYEADKNGNPYQQCLWYMRMAFFPEKLKKRMWISNFENEIDREILVGSTYEAGSQFEVHTRK